MLKNWNRIIRRLGSIYVDTIYEHTAANGVAIDSVYLKDGHIGVGLAAVAGRGITAWETVTDTDNSSYYGGYFRVEGVKTTAAFTSTMFGAAGVGVIDSTNTQNWTNATLGLVGLYGFAGTETGTAAAKTITGMAALYSIISVSGTAANDPLVTNAYGLYMGATTLVGNSKLTNCYGIYIGDQAGGGTLNYAIYSAGGNVAFIGSATDCGTSCEADAYTVGGVAGDDESSSGTITTFTITIVKGIVTAFAKVS